MLSVLTCVLTQLPSCALLSAELSETQCADLSPLHHITDTLSAMHFPVHAQEIILAAAVHV